MGSVGRVFALRGFVRFGERQFDFWASLSHRGVTAAGAVDEH